MQFHKDHAFDIQFKRTLGSAVNGGAEICECLSIIDKIKTRDYIEWHDRWRAIGELLDLSAEGEQLAGCSISAGQKWLRASNYYRTAYFFLEQNPEDVRIQECVQLSKQSFQKALNALEIAATPIQIPFGGASLPGYLYLADNPNAHLIIDTGGGDSTLEEMYFYSAKPGLQRGYHCLSFEGPGQGSVLRLQKLPFRPDWETVIKAVIDTYQKKYPHHRGQTILRGDSFGGYLAARAAVFEERISALVLNPGILNPIASLQRLSSEPLRKVIFLLSPDLKFKVESRFMRFGASSFQELMQRCKEYTLEGNEDKISCRTLILDNEEEHLTKGEALKLFNKLQCPKRYVLFKKEQSTGGHCQPLGQMITQEAVFNWLDKELAQNFNACGV